MTNAESLNNELSTTEYVHVEEPINTEPLKYVKLPLPETKEEVVFQEVKQYKLSFRDRELKRKQNRKRKKDIKNRKFKHKQINFNLSAKEIIKLNADLAKCKPDIDNMLELSRKLSTFIKVVLSEEDSVISTEEKEELSTKVHSFNTNILTSSMQYQKLKDLKISDINHVLLITEFLSNLATLSSECLPLLETMQVKFKEFDERKKDIKPIDLTEELAVEKESNDSVNTN